MSEHYTRNTVSVSAYCNKCGKTTQHRVDDVRKGPCLECMIRAEIARIGIPMKERNGEIVVQCTDATLSYLHQRVWGLNTEYMASVLCPCSQRDWPHELSVHSNLKAESYNPDRRFQWPWSLMLSERVEPSTERKQVA